MVNIRNYYFSSIPDKAVKPEESFINSYVDKFFESDSTIISQSRMHIILYTKYWKSDLNAVIDENFQHLYAAERYRLISLLRKFGDPVDLKLKDDANPIC